MRTLKQRLDLELADLKAYKLPEGLQGSALAQEKAYHKGCLDTAAKFRQMIKDMGV